MGISTDDLKMQVARIAELRKTEALASAAKKQATELLDEAYQAGLEMLEQAGLKNFKCEFGAIDLAMRTSVRIPREPEALDLFRSYVARRGELELVQSINSAKLNSWFEAHLEECIRLKLDPDVPGLENCVTAVPILRFRKV